MHKISTLIFLSGLIISCSTQQKEAPETTDQAEEKKSTEFVPNPQHVAKQEVKILEIGQEAPDFSLPDVSGKFYSLADFKDSKTLVIVFTCNHCPTAQAYEDRMIAITNDYKDKGVAMLAIMPNSTSGLLPEECGYTDLNDTYDEMKIRSRDKGYNFPYLYDGDDQKVAIAYGPATTPHAFVFNAERKLVYVGRIDAHEKPGTGNGEDLRQALDETLAGTTVTTPVNKAFGCSVKWGWKDEWNKEVEKQWNDKPVAISKINKKEVTELVKNKSDKLRLINVWATWCAPCVAEYPSLIQTQRMYGQRDFEFISISADKPENENKALAFLKEKHSPIKNFLFEGKDNYELVEALDPEWNGALPYTLLVEPGGKIVYRYQGPVDMLELKRAIVDHPMIGRYY